MPPRAMSRHVFTEDFLDSAGNTVLTERVPFRFYPYNDNILHVVRDGDTLFNLAARYYAGMDRPAGLWWVIADFQPTPIHDPTLPLTLNTVIIIPSSRTVVEKVMSESRRLESSL